LALAPVPATGPVVALQVVTPLTPTIAQVPTPLGAIALVGPATTVEKWIVVPRAALAPVLSLTMTDGATLATVVV
jgi:hypothetical protein